MKTPRRQIASLFVKRSLVTGASVKKLSRAVAAYLLETGRTGELESLLRDIALLRAERGIVEVMAVSAHELSAVVRADIEYLVKELHPHARHIMVSERIDSSVIGGVRLELLDRQLDLSIRSKLNRFRQLTATERTTA